MEREKAQGSRQKHFHEHAGITEHGEGFAVTLIGMRRIADEVRVRRGVAASASSNEIRGRGRRLRIGRRQDVVFTMTIPATRAVDITNPGDMGMESVVVSLFRMLMTSPAGRAGPLVRSGPRADLMGGVAIRANRRS